jgi:hypothetical protein
MKCSEMIRNQSPGECESRASGWLTGAQNPRYDGRHAWPVPSWEVLVGFTRRLIRKSVRRATPRPVRQAMHPARTVRNAVTPRPVKQASHAVYTARHPAGAAENAAIGAALYPPKGRRGKSTGRLTIWQLLTGRVPAPPTARRTAPSRTTPRTGALPRPASPPASMASPVRRPAPPPPPAGLRRGRSPNRWPANKAFRGEPPPLPSRRPAPGWPEPRSLGDAELQDYGSTGWGDGSHIKGWPDDEE